MKRHLPLYLAFVCTLALGLFLALPEAAEAGCDGLCERVSPGCKECIHTGSFTGANCEQSGPCFCLYSQCASGPQVSAEATVAPDGVPELLREVPEMTTETTAEARACELMAFLSLQNVALTAE
ncbi:MAG TPA: hypothetical protein VJG13_11170 [Thermoanaerobaculia bacterium]|nr:hypothetical protein [Thermoanaerobaculia bacterium]